MVREKGADKVTLAEEPYFMKNKEWYYYDEKEGKLFLTDKAPKEARESYEEYYKQFEDIEEI